MATLDGRAKTGRRGRFRVRSNPSGRSAKRARRVLDRSRDRARWPRSLGDQAMNAIIYLVGLVVVVYIILSFFGLL